MATAVLKHPDGIVPFKGSLNAADYDMHSIESIIIPVEEQRKVNTWICMIFSKQYFGFVTLQSGLAAKHSISIPTGIIYPDYTGTIHVLLHNNG
eukprot:4812515-Ditylum_brightwellii.AAC.1